MKYLPTETAKYLDSLGCKSDADVYDYDNHCQVYSLEDILRKDTIAKIRDVVRASMKSRIDDVDIAEHFAWLVYNYPDTWPEEVSKLIHPTQSESNQEIQPQ